MGRGKKGAPTRDLRTCLQDPYSPTPGVQLKGSGGHSPAPVLAPGLCNLSLATAILPATSLGNPTGLRTLATWLCAQPGPGSHARSFSLMTASSQRLASLSTEPSTQTA